MPQAFMQSSPNYGSTGLPLTKAEPRNDFSPYVAEFAGTFMLVFITGCCEVAGDRTWNPTAIGSAVIGLTYALGPVSGGVFNPAVTLALAFAGKLHLFELVSYVCMQFFGGILGGLAYASLLKKSVEFGPSFEYTGWQVGPLETIYTALICFVFLNCAASSRNNPKDDRNQFYALAIGLAVMAGGYSVNGISDIALNPAVALGLDLTGYDYKAYWGFHYCISEFLGALLAAVLFLICRKEDFIADPQRRNEYVPKLGNRAICEFAGAFIMVLTIGLCLVTHQTAAPWAAAAALASLSYALADVSGGHFNPAVSLAVVLSGRNKCRALDGFVYSIAHAGAGLLAALIFARVAEAGPKDHKVHGLEPHEDYTWSTALVSEFAFTTFYAFAFLAAATTKPLWLVGRSFYFALAIGACLAASGFAVGSVSGSVLNPAVGLGVAYSAGSAPSSWLAYSAVELLGSVAGVFFFALIYPDEYIKSKPLFPVQQVSSPGIGAA